MASRSGRVHGARTRTDGERVGNDEIKEKRAETHVATAALGCSASDARQNFFRSCRPRNAARGASPSPPQKRKRPDSVRVIGRSSNSPPPKSAQNHFTF